MGKKIVVVINGAPNSGKDASAGIMKNLMGYGAIKAFKDALYTATAKHFGLDREAFVSVASNRDTKEVPQKFLVRKTGKNIFQKAILTFIGWFINIGLTPRQALIHVSEDIIKKQFTDTFFGDRLKEDIDESDADIFYIPDSGFFSELKPLVDAGFNVHVLRIHRDGCTFDNDSRSLLTDEILEPLGLVGFDIDNNGTLEDLEEALKDYLIGTVIESL